jgi:hypothetical protein
VNKSSVNFTSPTSRKEREKWGTPHVFLQVQVYSCSEQDVGHPAYMLKRYKWRLILSLFNLLIAIAQSALGLHSAKVILKQATRYDNVFLFIPTPQVISDCINAPAFILPNLIGNTALWKNLWGERWLGAYVFYQVPMFFYILLSLFWWWIGWRFDTRLAINDQRRALQVSVNVLGAALSLGLLGIGLKLALTDSQSLQLAGGLAIPIATCVWGCLLLGYFVRNLVFAGGLFLRSSSPPRDV